MQIGLRRISDLGLLIIFMLLSILLFPIAIGPEPQILSRIAAGLIWVVILFSTHLAMPSIWQQDIEDGTFEQYILSGLLLEWFVLSKVMSTWLLQYGCILFLLPLMGFSLNLETSQIFQLQLTFLISSIPLSFLSSTGALLSYGTNKPSVLSSIILLPLYLPLLIFSCAICDPNTPDDTSSMLLILTSVGLILSPAMLYLNVYLLKECR